MELSARSVLKAKFKDANYNMENRGELIKVVLKVESEGFRRAIYINPYLNSIEYAEEQLAKVFLVDKDIRF